MHLLRHAVFVSFAALALAASGNARSADESAAGKTFRAGTAQWVAAYNAGDADRILALYADDAVLMPPDAPAAAGHAAMREFLTKDIASSKAAGITLIDVNSATGTSGDLGWHAGTFAVVDAAGKTLVTGKYAEVWQKKNGKWRLIRDIWNNDARPAAAPAAPGS